MNVHNRFEKDTPLHVLADSSRPEEEFEAMFDILVANGDKTVAKKLEMDAENGRGMTPLYCAFLGSRVDAARRGLYIAKQGAEVTGHRADDIKDNFWAIVYNRSLTDQKSYDLIVHLLDFLASRQSKDGEEEEEEGNIDRPNIDDHERIISFYRPTYQRYFQPSLTQNQEAYMLSLWVSATSGRLATTRLLLDLALPSPEISRLINSPRPSPSNAEEPGTLLDSVVKAAEYARQNYMFNLRSFRVGAARERAIQQNLAVDPGTDFPEREIEKYMNLPQIVRMLREKYDAKMSFETFSMAKKWYLWLTAPDAGHESHFLYGAMTMSDLTRMYEYEYTPETQPHREQWAILYELAGAGSDYADNQIVAYLKERYCDKYGWRPHVKLLQTKFPTSTSSHSQNAASDETEGSSLFTRNRDRVLPKLIAGFATLGKRHSDGTVWIEACDDTSIAAEAKVRVEIVDGKRIGRIQKIEETKEDVDTTRFDHLASVFANRW